MQPAPPDPPHMGSSSPLTPLVSSCASSASPRPSSPSGGPHQPDGDEELKGDNEGVEAPNDTSPNTLDASLTPAAPATAPSDSAPTSGFEQQQREQDELQLDYDYDYEGDDGGYGGIYEGMVLEVEDGEEKGEEVERAARGRSEEEGEGGGKDGGQTPPRASLDEAANQPPSTSMESLGVLDLTSPTTASFDESDPNSPLLGKSRSASNAPDKTREGASSASTGPEAVIVGGILPGDFSASPPRYNEQKPPTLRTTNNGRLTPRSGSYHGPTLQFYGYPRATPPPASHTLYRYVCDVPSRELGNLLIGRHGRQQKAIKAETNLADLSILYHNDIFHPSSAVLIGTESTIRAALAVIRRICYTDDWSRLFPSDRAVLDTQGEGWVTFDPRKLERQLGYWTKPRFSDVPPPVPPPAAPLGAYVPLSASIPSFADQPPRPTDRSPPTRRNPVPSGSTAPARSDNLFPSSTSTSYRPQSRGSNDRSPNTSRLPPPSLPPPPNAMSGTNANATALGPKKREYGGGGAGRAMGESREEKRDERAADRQRQEEERTSERRERRRSPSPFYDGGRRSRRDEKDMPRRGGSRSPPRVRAVAEERRRRPSVADERRAKKEKAEGELLPFEFDIPPVAASHFLPTSPTILFLEQLSGCSFALSTSGSSGGAKLAISGAKDEEKLARALRDVERTVSSVRLVAYLESPAAISLLNLAGAVRSPVHLVHFYCPDRAYLSASDALGGTSRRRAEAWTPA
ncbi:hypothetical protein JCM8097_006153 [Rhodosporidiobolus ruineniae]